MATCEDAPCCGCCGTNIYGAYQGDDGGSDDYDDDSFYEDYDGDDEDVEDEPMSELPLPWYPCRP